MNMQRSGWARGAKPGRPGDLTQKIFRDNQARAEATKRAKEGADPYETGFRTGWGSGFDSGWDAGVEAIVLQLTEAGIDVQAVLSLDDEPGDE